MKKNKSAVLIHNAVICKKVLLILWGIGCCFMGMSEVTNNVDQSDAIISLDRASEYWEDLLELTDEGMELLTERQTLPYEHWFRRDRNDNAEDIRENHQLCKELLLSEDTHNLLKRLRKVEKKISEVRTDIDTLIEKKLIYVSKEKKLNAKIQDLEKDLAKLNSNRLGVLAEISTNVQQTAGIKLESKELECLLAIRTSEEAIDNAIVAMEIRKILMKLQLIMREKKDSQSARRYYGMYLVLVDMQIQATEEVDDDLNKVWIPKINAYMQAAEKERQKAIEGAMDNTNTESIKLGFQANRKANEIVLQASKVYRQTLEKRSHQYKTSIRNLQMMRKLAQNSYDTAQVASDFMSLLKSSEETFNTLASVELPEFDISGIDDLTEEFHKITRNISEQQMRELELGTSK